MNSIINVIGYAINIDIVPLPGQQQDMATGPVSYTHLDVYKRQLMKCVRCTMIY